ncbi:hypothetical protein halTADL_1671 [Halohasta litchfieldiae]|jgi:hypothetical protein|uniref:Uncharacterized protein n=1 Tax=Halohasta litchfieldiae TaxID=1073996 RepID=A0A1H6V2H0_9EURY|nr:hypothetical protein [Halohasta litchfieldiae]ATW88426.1 hypothetical protein halTADL_1671 [Halohasta litchfieldiae]SEI94820.1 hypothetical protein SAMN05444271_11320 [Halohasta litchfieldiae]
MEWRTATGVGLFVVGIVGYTAGVSLPYPGREFSLTAVMVGIAIAAIAQSGETI